MILACPGAVHAGQKADGHVWTRQAAIPPGAMTPPPSASMPGGGHPSVPNDGCALSLADSLPQRPSSSPRPRQVGDVPSRSSSLRRPPVRALPAPSVPNCPAWTPARNPARSERSRMHADPQPPAVLSGPACTPTRCPVAARRRDFSPSRSSLRRGLEPDHDNESAQPASPQLVTPSYSGMTPGYSGMMVPGGSRSDPLARRTEPSTWRHPPAHGGGHQAPPGSGAGRTQEVLRLSQHASSIFEPGVYAVSMH